MSDTTLYIIIGAVAFVVLFLVIGANGAKKKKEEEEKKRLAEIEEAKQKEEQIKRFEKYKSETTNYDQAIAEFKTMNSSHIKKIIDQHERRLSLIEKYGKEEAEKIFNHQYWIGMTEEQVIDAKGQPTKIENEVLKTKTKKTLIYGTKSGGDVFVLVEGKVERFNDR